MSRPAAPVVLFLLCLVLAGAANAQLDAPVWYVQYEVRVHTDTSLSGNGMRGLTTTAYKVNNVFSNTVKLDMRNDGAVLSMDMSKIATGDYAKLSPQEQLKITQQMLDGMQSTANWMQGPIEVGEDSNAMLNHMKDVSVPLTIDYEITTTGNNLVNEVGDHYDFFEQTTATYSGGNVYTSPDQVKFEMNTAKHKYWLVLPYNFQDMSGSSNSVSWVTVTKHRATGTTAWDPEERSTNTSGVDIIGSAFRLNPLPNGATQPVIEGTLDASGKISGEKSFTGRMDRTGEAPVTLTYRYTVSRTPPPPPVAKK